MTAEVLSFQHSPSLRTFHYEKGSAILDEDETDHPSPAVHRALIFTDRVLEDQLVEVLRLADLYPVEDTDLDEEHSSLSTTSGGTRSSSVKDTTVKKQSTNVPAPFSLLGEQYLQDMDDFDDSSFDSEVRFLTVLERRVSQDLQALEEVWPEIPEHLFETPQNGIPLIVKCMSDETDTTAEDSFNLSWDGEAEKDDDDELSISKLCETLPGSPLTRPGLERRRSILADSDDHGLLTPSVLRALLSAEMVLDDHLVDTLKLADLWDEEDEEHQATLLEQSNDSMSSLTTEGYDQKLLPSEQYKSQDTLLDDFDDSSLVSEVNLLTFARQTIARELQKLEDMWPVIPNLFDDDDVVEDTIDVIPSVDKSSAANATDVDFAATRRHWNQRLVLHAIHCCVVVYVVASASRTSKTNSRFYVPLFGR